MPDPISPTPQASAVQPSDEPTRAPRSTPASRAHRRARLAEIGEAANRIATAAEPEGDYRVAVFTKNDITLEMKMGYLELIRRHGGSMTRAAEASGISIRTWREIRKNDPEFAEQVLAARDEGAEALEDEAIRRAHVGVAEPVFHKGQIVGTIQRYSDRLLEFLLRGMLRHKYGPEGRGPIRQLGEGGDEGESKGTFTKEELAEARQKIASALDRIRPKEPAPDPGPERKIP